MKTLTVAVATALLLGFSAPASFSHPRLPLGTYRMRLSCFEGDCSYGSTRIVLRDARHYRYYFNSWGSGRYDHDASGRIRFTSGPLDYRYRKYFHFTRNGQRFIKRRDTAFGLTTLFRLTR